MSENLSLVEADEVNVYDEINLLDLEEELREDVDVEKLLAAVSKCRSEVDFLKRLKQARIEPIDQKIEYLDKQEEKLKDLILFLMPKLFPDKNSIDFPGLGKVTKRKTTGKWDITDEDVFKSYVKEKGMAKDIIETKEVINKKQLSKVIALILTKEKQENLKGVVFTEPTKEATLAVQLYTKETETKEKVTEKAAVEKPKTATEEVGF